MAAWGPPGWGLTAVLWPYGCRLPLTRAHAVEAVGSCLCPWPGESGVAGTWPDNRMSVSVRQTESSVVTEEGRLPRMERGSPLRKG